MSAAPNASVPTLETGRLLLRGYRESDVDALDTMAADPIIAPFLTNGQIPLREACWRSMALWIGHWALRGFGMWAVEEKASGAFIGRIGLWRPEGWPGTEVGWMLGREWWSRGYASEAARASVVWGFANLDVPELVSLIDPANDRSIRVAEGLGEQYRGMIPFRDGETALYGVTREEWDAREIDAGGAV